MKTLKKCVFWLELATLILELGLNVVALSHELELFEGISANKEVKVIVDEKYCVSVSFGEDKCPRRILTIQQKEDLIQFKRYIDDTQEVIASDNYESAKDIIKKILTTYP